MQATLDNFSWHTPVLDVAWPFFGTAAAAALVGAILGGLCGRVFGEQRAGESFRDGSPDVSGRAILVLSIGYAMLVGAAVALVNLT